MAYHVELKQGLGSARRFNLTPEQLQSRFLAPWLAGQAIELDERSYLPGQAKLRIIEGPELPPAAIGLGRGWANAGRHGEDVTDRLLAERRGPSPPAGGDAAVEEFKAMVAIACSHGRLPLRSVVAMAGARHPRARASEQLALAERTVWELLHQGRVSLHAPGAGEPLAPEGWAAVVLSWDSWTGDAAIAAAQAAAQETTDASISARSVADANR